MSIDEPYGGDRERQWKGRATRDELFSEITRLVGRLEDRNRDATGPAIKRRDAVIKRMEAELKEQCENKNRVQLEVNDLRTRMRVSKTVMEPTKYGCLVQHYNEGSGRWEQGWCDHCKGLEAEVERLKKVVWQYKQITYNGKSLESLIERADKAEAEVERLKKDIAGIMKLNEQPYEQVKTLEAEVERLRDANGHLIGTVDRLTKDRGVDRAEVERLKKMNEDLVCLVAAQWAKDVT